MKTLAREFVSRVKHLPSADAVAAFLREEGITGTRLDCERCPLARLGRAWFDVKFSVGAYAVYAGDAPSRWVAELPPAAYEFRVFFDRGKYPDLEDMP